jgi:GT2 family glycosyltransferase
MPAPPLISVALLSHNRPAALPRAVESVLAQTYRPLELIVVDNPSPRTPEIEAVVARYPGVRFIRNARNLGFSGGINVGIRAAVGPLTYVTEDDIVLEPDCLTLLQAHLAADPGVGFATPILLDEQTRKILAAGGDYELGPVF